MGSTGFLNSEVKFFCLPYIFSVFYEVAKVPALSEEALTSWGHVLITLWRKETSPPEYLQSLICDIHEKPSILLTGCVLCFKPQKIYKAPLKLRILFYDKYKELCNAGF